MHKIVCQPHCAQWQAHRLLNMAFAGYGELATTTAQVHHQHGRRTYAQGRREPKMNQARFFESRDDFDIPSRCRAYPFEKSAGIACITQSTRGDDTDRIGPGTLASAVKSTQYLDRESNCLRGKKSAAEDRFTQSCDLSVLMNFDQSVSGEAGNFQAD